MGIGVFGILGIVFVTLKLAGIIAWPWILVTAPFWGGYALLGIVFIAFALAEPVKGKR